MTSRPRRARFQIHLSTAVVLMFVAGGLIWANVGSVAKPRPTPGLVELSDEDAYRIGRNWDQGILPLGERGDFFGWPVFPVCTKHGCEGVETNGVISLVDNPSTWHWGAIAANACVALALLVFVYMLCEWLIRRRAARKGA